MHGVVDCRSAMDDMSLEVGASVVAACRTLFSSASVRSILDFNSAVIRLNAAPSSANSSLLTIRAGSS